MTSEPDRNDDQDCQRLWLPQRRLVRSITREAFIQAKGDEHNAIELAQYRVRTEMRGILSVILIGVALTLVIDLIVYWIKQLIDFPEAEYQTGEPGASDV